MQCKEQFVKVKKKNQDSNEFLILKKLKERDCSYSEQQKSIDEKSVIKLCAKNHQKNLKIHSIALTYNALTKIQTKLVI